jgi:Mg2+/Co2+ transporter CorB
MEENKMNGEQVIGLCLLAITIIAILLCTFVTEVSSWMYVNVGPGGICALGFASLIMLIPTVKGNPK